MKEVIKKLLRESLLDEVKHDLNSINNLILLSPSTNNTDSITFLIYDPIIKKPVGYINFGYHKPADVYSVYGIYSVRGYGPLLYEMAMTYVYPNGLSLSQDGGTSGDALDVWDKFIKRGDVKKEPITRNVISNKEKDLIGGCDNNKECLKWVHKIIKLHNTKFIFNIGKDKILSLINKGLEYIKNNNISDDDIEHMCWDLEG